MCCAYLSYGSYNPEVAIDSNGDAIAIWEKSDLIRRDSIWTSSFNGINWSGAQLIETGNNAELVDVNYPKIAINGGNAIAVWSAKHIGTGYNIWANYFE